MAPRWVVFCYKSNIRYVLLYYNQCLWSYVSSSISSPSPRSANFTRAAAADPRRPARGQCADPPTRTPARPASARAVASRGADHRRPEWRCCRYAKAALDGRPRRATSPSTRSPSWCAASVTIGTVTLHPVDIAATAGRFPCRPSERRDHSRAQTIPTMLLENVRTGSAHWTPSSRPSASTRHLTGLEVEVVTDEAIDAAVSPDRIGLASGRTIRLAAPARQDADRVAGRNGPPASRLDRACAQAGVCSRGSRSRQPAPARWPTSPRRGLGSRSCPRSVPRGRDGLHPLRVRSRTPGTARARVARGPDQPGRPPVLSKGVPGDQARECCRPRMTISIVVVPGATACQRRCIE